MSLNDEIKRRRTFAIISHPDAGKTTLTEKFLLYGGALQLAGNVKVRKQQRASASDWMDLEKKRGISVSSTVLQFEYGGCYVNLLDTPGHKDFSEDTYRVLTAVDAAVMVVDAGKGIETQTRKLFEVCRQRGVPIFTFMNKLDRPAKNPLDLIDELESVLGIAATPINWPLGNGQQFKGVFDRLEKQAHFFEKVPGGSYRAPVSIMGIEDDEVKAQLDPTVFESVSEELAMLDEAGHPFDKEQILAGELTPVFFGSASNNFGVELLLKGFLQFSPPPQSQTTLDCGELDPASEDFSAFIFKIQANMDPRHRDRIAFMRICSGKFERDMTVHHSRTGKKVRLSSSHKLFGQDRETLDEAYAGDILGIVGHDEFGIGDTLSTNPKLQFRDLPRFTPECFSYIHGGGAAQFKRFRSGLDQLLQEGVVQSLQIHGSQQRIPLLAAVGPLQFEVVQYRMETEYNAETRMEPAPFSAMRWVEGEKSVDELAAEISLPTGVRIAEDIKGYAVFLFPEEWAIRYFQDNNPSIKLIELPPDVVENFGSELTG